ncbi:MAG: hypothetical protein NTW19_01215 [Planctomycetota bacterium]|nr:hypothetical protein [Planctomycetota bacterium]
MQACPRGTPASLRSLSGRSTVCRATPIIAFVMACVLTAGCSDREKLGEDYVLVTPSTMGPDSHPGTSLRWKEKVVWKNVYVGYFSPAESSQFCHDGMFVFVAPVPGNNDWWLYPQLFAVRGGKPPVVLSERLLGQRLSVSYRSGEMSTFSARAISPFKEGVRAVFEYQVDSNNKATKPIELTWAEIKQMLDEADTSARAIHHELGDYRVLPVR